MYVPRIPQECKGRRNGAVEALEDRDPLVPNQHQPPDTGAERDLRHGVRHVAVQVGVPPELRDQGAAPVQQDFPVREMWSAHAFL